MYIYTYIYIYQVAEANEDEDDFVKLDLLPGPRQALRTSIKSQFWKILITFGDECPRMAPRTGRRLDLLPGDHTPGTFHLQTLDSQPKALNRQPETRNPEP